jgi:hypothetical protein
MRCSQIQQRYIERDPSALHIPLNHVRKLSRTSRDFQQGKPLEAGGLSHAFDHSLSSGYASEPAVDAFDHSQHRLSFGGRACIRIENLRRVDSLHRRVKKSDQRLVVSG